MMRRYTMEDDKHIVFYLKHSSSWHIADDLRRTPDSITARVRRLNANGGWKALEDVFAAESRYHLALRGIVE